MSLDTDDEILQDFLVEAEEILEGLNEQIVALESRTEDSELLNAIFRGFHTIKGGAGFLALDSVVALCHKGEDLFNMLREGDIVANADMVDVFLKVLDFLTDMFEEAKSGEPPSPADPEILNKLQKYIDGDSAKAPAQEKPEPEVIASLDAAESNDITDDEFEALLNQLHSEGTPGKTQAAAKSIVDTKNDSDDITDEEFETLLDDLQSKKTNIPKILSTPELEKDTPELKKTTERSASVKNGTSAKSAIVPKQAETSVRVDTSRLDEIMNLVGELVLVKNRITTLETTIEDDEMAKAVNNLVVVTSDLQASVMKTRMQPIKKVFARFPRVVRDLARDLKKEINLELHGEDTGLDKNLVEALADPLVHLVRNAVGHGIEIPDVREAAGKPRLGQVALRAAQEGDHILLTISDDGAGMNPKVLRQKAVEKGIMDEESASRLTDSESYALIFTPGFSMKTKISDISGRGVGMDVVKTSISNLSGVIEIDSSAGVGTTFSITLPLTLAIMPTLMVILGDQAFAFPLANVNEIFHLDTRKINTIDGQQTVMVRNKTLPLVYLRKWLASGSNETKPSEIEHVVIVSVGTQRVGFVVDKLIGQEEVVIKPLGALLQGTKGLAGVTITGDGRISFIVDFPELMNAYANHGY